MAYAEAWLPDVPDTSVVAATHPHWMDIHCPVGPLDLTPHPPPGRLMVIGQWPQFIPLERSASSCPHRFSAFKPIKHGLPPILSYLILSYLILSLQPICMHVHTWCTHTHRLYLDRRGSITHMGMMLATKAHMRMILIILRSTTTHSS